MMFQDTPHEWITEIKQSDVLQEVVDMINNGHLKKDFSLLDCIDEVDAEMSEENEIFEYPTWQEAMAAQYLEYVHNDASKYSTTERLHYLAGRYY